MKIKRSLVIVIYFVFEILIIVQDKTLSNKDYLFKLILFDAYSYIANKEISFVYICSNYFVSLRILQRAMLRHLLEFKKQDFY